MGEKRTKDTTTSNPESNTDDNGYEDNGYESEDPDIGPSYFDMPDKTFNHENETPCQEKVWLILFFLAQCTSNIIFCGLPFKPLVHMQENADAHANLEDLCRSHLVRTSYAASLH